MNKALKLFVFFISIFQLNCQSQIVTDSEKAEIKAYFLSNSGSTEIKIPEKWKNESAIITFKDVRFYASGGKTGTVFGKCDVFLREKVKILDAASVNKFSEVYFYDSKSDNTCFYGVIIHKTDGSKVSIDEDKAVEVSLSDEGDIIVINPFSLWYATEKDFKKLALPSVEMGDVVEIYYMHRISVSYSAPIHDVLINDTYPVLYQRYEYNVSDGYLYNLKAINNCPPIICNGIGSQIDQKLNKKIERFSIVDSNREKISDEKMLLDELQFPILKIHISKYVKYPSDQSLMSFSDWNTTIEKDVSKEDLIKVFKGIEYVVSVGNFGFFKIEKIRKQLSDADSPVEIAIKTFYLFPSNIYSDFYWLSAFSETLAKLKIDHRIVAIIPRNIGDLTRVVRPDELVLCIEVRDENGKKVYFYEKNKYCNVSLYHPLLDGAEAYAYYPKYTKYLHEELTDISVKKLTMPALKPEDSRFHTSLVATFDFENESLNVDANVEVSGYSKLRINNSILYGYDLSSEYELLFPLEKEKNTDVESENEKRLELEEMLKQRNERMVEILNEDYKIGTLKSMEVLNSGCFTDPVLKYKQSYTINNIFSRAGNNIILDLGALAGSQLELDEKDVIRKNDIYYWARCINSYDIKVEIPDGYIVGNLNDFIINIDNECMALKTNAGVEGNYIHFTFEKIYKSDYDPKENWPKYVEVLEAAYDLTQKKVIMRKN